MAMMQIGKVRVRMRERCMMMGMGVRLAAVPGKIVRVLVMRVVHMSVVMIERLVHVRVFVPFAHVQPDARRH